LFDTSLIDGDRRTMANTAMFETDVVGTTPSGWTATMTGRGNPRWTVEWDKTAPSKSKVVKQSGHATYPLLLKDDTNIKNGFIEMKFKALAGSADRRRSATFDPCSSGPCKARFDRPYVGGDSSRHRRRRDRLS
jgi:hypothetical protein